MSAVLRVQLLMTPVPSLIWIRDGGVRAERRDAVACESRLRLPNLVDPLLFRVLDEFEILL